MNAVSLLPVDIEQATLVGRVWLPGPQGGPSTVVVKHGMVFDISAHAPIMADLLDQEDCVGFVRSLDGDPLGTAADLVRRSLDRSPGIGGGRALRALRRADRQGVWRDLHRQPA